MATGIPKTQWQGTVDITKPNNPVLLHYPNKQSENAILSTPPALCHLLWSSDSQPKNQLYFGDNLPILAKLSKNLNKKIKLVYIDPPFATNRVFQSRQQVDAYQDLRIGATYLEFLRQRIVLLRELLADDGSIYVHLDLNMAFQAKVLLDEIFGTQNFRSLITRQKCNPKNYTRKTYGNISDYILFYTKSNQYIWHRPYEPWDSKRADKEYTYTEPNTGRKYKKVPIHAPGVRNGATGQPWRDKLPPPGKHWQYTPTRLDEMDANGEIAWSANGNPRRKIYLDQSMGIPVQDIWLDVKDAHNQNIKITGYPTEKPMDLLRRIIEASSNEGDIVLDCFAGSGTTLAVANELKRHWIGIDNSLVAIETIVERFLNGLAPMGDFVNGANKPEQLALFAPINEPSVKNFAFYASEPYDQQLNQVVKRLMD